MRRVVLAVTVVLVMTGASRAAAQETVRDAAGELLGGGFQPAEIDAVASVLAAQISTFPTGTSSGGYTWEFFEGAPRLRQQGFGPLFAERASTLGKAGSFTFGLSAQATRFESFEGHDVRTGELRTRTVFNGQLVDLDRFTFDVSTQTTSVSFNYALTQAVDVGVIVPFIQTSLNGTASSFQGPSQLRAERIVDSTQTGLGDVLVRGKWNFFSRPQAGLAAVGEAILPTGSEERLTSTGVVRVRPMFIASATVGAFAPHVNVGYTFGGDGADVISNGQFLPTIVRGEIGDEFNYTIGGEVFVAGTNPATTKVTLFADLIGRTLRGVTRFDSGERYEATEFGTILIETFVARRGSLHTRLGVVGGKLSVFQAGLISAGLLFPLSQGGLGPGLTPVIGFEYTR
jgi:hypothetical protein